jgi:hypothetical protein
VVCPENRDGDRCDDARRGTQTLWRRAAVSRQRAHRDHLLPDAIAHHVVRSHGIPGNARVRRQRRLERRSRSLMRS